MDSLHYLVPYCHSLSIFGTEVNEQTNIGLILNDYSDHTMHLKITESRYPWNCLGNTCLLTKILKYIFDLYN